MTEPLRYAKVPTSVGALWVAYDPDDHIWMTQLRADERAFVERCRRELGATAEPDPTPPAPLLAAVEARLRANVPLPFHLDDFTPFQRAVLEEVAAIPRGEVRTYGEVAFAVGHMGAARAVGEVMRTNRFPVLIPCHRGVRSGGDIGRYTPDPEIKRQLLIEEGALAPGP